jgi:hypothetical protein
MGWKDGCQSGMASSNTSFNQAVGAQQYSINSELQNDNLYTIAWQYAYNHCGFSMKTLTQYSL